MADKTFSIQDISDYEGAASAILDTFPHRLYLLKGDLGAGKTTLVQAFLKVLNSKDRVTSPTFSIIQEYLAADDPVYHMDLYRLESLEEAIATGIEDYLYSDAYCFIEWPSLLGPLLDEFNYVLLELKITDDTSRSLVVQVVDHTMT